MLSDLFHAFSEQAAGIAVTAVWQGAIVAGGLAIVLRFAPRTSAEHRFSIWGAAFATLVGLPVVSIILSSFSTSPVAGLSSISSGSAQGPWLSVDARWSLAIAALWVAATVFRAGDLSLHTFRLRKIWREAIPVELDERLSCAHAALGLRAPIQVCTTATLQRPSVIGFFKPRILIPDWLFARLTPGELEQIVLHEAEHLRRRDDWTNLFQKLCLVLFPLNPALNWIEHRLCREREMACDEGVIKITHAPRAYAACLASLAERGLQRRAEALSLGAWQHRPELVHRVHSILRVRRTLGPMGTRALMGALGCSLLIGSIELARCPQLVAFIPARNQRQNSDTATVGAAQGAGAAKLMNASYVPARSARGKKSFSAPHATKVAAHVRANGALRQVAQTSNERGNADRIGTKLSDGDAKLARLVPLKAEMQSAQPDAGQAYQFIVLTTWQQGPAADQNAGQTAGLIADFDTGASAKPQAGDQKKTQNAGKSTEQMTVTRLIFRVVPASSFPTQPALVPTRNGWLILQL